MGGGRHGERWLGAVLQRHLRQHGNSPSEVQVEPQPGPALRHGAAQDALCPDPKMCTGMTDGQNAVPDLEIVDRVLIPKGLTPGPYVLGWRWDCEESNQIWQSCSDLTIV